ncbi:hypothetical protein [Erythrobacter sp. R86502]|uniref:hypothetical protein n=1 Tax=Erythrobacter sp. R86502 TaxID=3093846 RepID=UPI0036D2A597
MAFSDRPLLSGRQKLGCAVVAAIGIFCSFIALIIAALGSCPECDPNPVVQFILMPGLPILFFGIGILMIRHFIRDKK